MVTVNEIMGGVGKFFIVLAYLCLAVASVFSLRDMSYRVTGMTLTMLNGFTLLAIIVYVVAMVAIVGMFAFTKKQPVEQQNNDLMSYVSDIYVNVNKNTESLDAIIQYLQETAQQPEDAEKK